MDFPWSLCLNFKCHDYDIAKITQQPYQLALHLPLTEKLGLVHTDICGRVPTSMEEYWYVVILTDDATGFKWILPLKIRGRWSPKSLSGFPMPKCKVVLRWWPFARTMTWSSNPPILRTSLRNEGSNINSRSSTTLHKVEWPSVPIFR